MSEQDDLRDRIAEVIFNAGMKPAEVVAQAVIDDLGLTVEERNNGETSESADGIEVIYTIESRVVGKWEKQ